MAGETRDQFTDWEAEAKYWRERHQAVVEKIRRIQNTTDTVLAFDQGLGALCYSETGGRRSSPRHAFYIHRALSHARRAAEGGAADV
jgi:hypothetical protein